MMEVTESVIETGPNYVVEKKTRTVEEETILVNGVPVQLAGPEADELKQCMLTGQIPTGLLERVLGQARLRAGTVAKVETSLTVKQKLQTKDTVIEKRNGVVTDEHTSGSNEEQITETSQTDVFAPVGDGEHCALSSQLFPTIFGTVADENNPDAGNKASLVPGGRLSCSSANQGSKYAAVPSSVSSNETPSPVLLNGSVYSDAGSSSQDSSTNPSEKEQQGLVYQHGGNLVSGSLDALVRHLIPTPDYYPERTYIFAFLLSSRLFIKPHILLGEVCKMCLLQQGLADLHITKEKYREKVCPNVIRLLSEWAELFPYDFRDERMMTHVQKIAQSDCVTKSDVRRKEVSLVLHNLLHKLSALEKYEEFLHKINTELKPRTFDQVPTADMTVICPNSVNLAKQLTRIELERLSYIGPEEFVQAFAKEAPNLETSFKDMKKTKNLESYIQWFNRLSFFVATEIVLNTKKKTRMKMIEYWIEVARECFNIGNFNSLMAIIAGLNMSPVARLKKTWSKVPTSKLSVLEQQMSPSSNFTSYRSTLAAAQWRSQTQSSNPIVDGLGHIRRVGPFPASSSSSTSSASSHSSAGSPHVTPNLRPDEEGRRRIIIPFFSLLVKDLYFLNEGCASRSPNGLINFEKFWQLAKQITEFMTWQQVNCPFQADPDVLTYLQTNPVYTEEMLAVASFECEPPDNNYEKERHKALKARYQVS